MQYRPGPRPASRHQFENGAAAEIARVVALGGGEAAPGGCAVQVPSRVADQGCARECAVIPTEAVQDLLLAGREEWTTARQKSEDCNERYNERVLAGPIVSWPGKRERLPGRL